jgi:hypothetical protein
MWAVEKAQGATLYNVRSSHFLDSYIELVLTAARQASVDRDCSELKGRNGRNIHPKIIKRCIYVEIVWFKDTG